MRTAFVTALGAAAFATGLAAQQGEPVSLALLLGRAAWYVEEFDHNFSNVVAEETYIQDATSFLPSFSPVPGGRGGVVSTVVVPSQVRHRALKSDFLLVRIPGFADWLPFRDVFDVDGIPVRDREERLSKLFVKPTGDAFDQAERIRDEGARFNLGSMKRTINNPVLPLVVVQAITQQRFQFTLGKPDPGVGPDVWIVEYKEQSRPTIIRGRPGFDLFAHGRMWIDAASGRVVKTEMFLEQPSLRAHVTTTFRFDERFGIAVPAAMHEDYVLDGGGRVAADATYGRFRRFDVSVDERLKQ
jgi:hypothetical protein